MRPSSFKNMSIGNLDGAYRHLDRCSHQFETEGSAMLMDEEIRKGFPRPDYHEDEFGDRRRFYPESTAKASQAGVQD